MPATSSRRKETGIDPSLSVAKPAENQEKAVPAAGTGILEGRTVSPPASGAEIRTGVGLSLSGRGTAGDRGGAGSSRTSGGATGSKGASAAGSQGGGESGAVGIGQPDGPQFLYRAVPEYPFALRRLRKEGRVILLVTIGEQGELRKVEVVEATDQLFAASAIAAVKRSTFLPAKSRGVAIASRATVPVRFTLRD